MATITDAIEDEDDAEHEPRGGIISITASLVRQGSHRFYSLTMLSKILGQTCTVDARHEDPIKGFQRRLEKRRAESIKKYIDEGFGTIPGSVILSAQQEAEFTYSRAKKVVNFRNIPRAFLILDGQHRVYGFRLSKNKLRVPVVIYSDLSKSDEARLFRDINTNQKPVPNELLLDINRMAQAETEDQAILHDIFDLFDKDPSSPLFGLMSPHEKTAGKISRVTFNASMRNIIEIFDLPVAQDIYDTLNGYYYAWQSVLKSKDLDDIITNPIAFRAITMLFKAAAEKVNDKYDGKYTSQNYLKILMPALDKLKKSDLVKSGASHVDIYNGLRKRLESGFFIKKAK